MYVYEMNAASILLNDLPNRSIVNKAYIRKFNSILGFPMDRMKKQHQFTFLLRKSALRLFNLNNLSKLSNDNNTARITSGNEKQRTVLTKLAVICTCTGFQKRCFSNKNLTIPCLEKVKREWNILELSSDKLLNFAMAESPLLPCQY